MKSARTPAALILLSAFVAGCRHKPPAPPPQAAQAPILPAGSMPQPHTPPQLPAPETPKVGLQTAKAAPPPETAPKHPRHRHPKPATDEAAAKDATGKDTAAKDAAEKDTTGKDADSAAAPATTQQAANMTPIPNAGSPIGQLSTAGDSANTMSRDAILQKINQTESGLNGIKRSLTSEEQTTTTQIRTFLTKAKQALEQDDLDGAHTLLTKAQVLLDELTKQ
jgi:hypothetical protein